MDVAAGTFAAITSGGPQQAISGLGFTPKLVILSTNGRIAAGNSALLDTNRFSWGAASGAAARGCMGVAGADGVNNGSRVWREDKLLELVDAAAQTTYCQADLVSLDADGFTITWGTLSPVASVIHYLAIGGSEVTNAKVGFFAANSSGNNPVDQAISTVGFQPDLLMLFAANATAVGISANTTPGVRLGAATGATEQFCVYGDNFSNTLVITALATKPASLKTLDANGFTLTWAPAGFAADRIGYIALKGGRYKVVSDTKPTANGNQAKTGVGFLPKAIYAVSNTGSLVNRVAAFALGAAISASVRRSLTFEWTSLNPMRSVTNYTIDKLLKLVHYASGQQTAGAADLVSFDADGYTLDWSGVDATARTFGTILFGDLSFPQKARPYQDGPQNGWERQDAGTPVAAAMDEVTLDNTDYAQSPLSPINPAVSHYKINAVNDPASSAGHTLKIDFGKDTPGSGDTLALTLRLFQGPPGSGGRFEILNKLYPDVEAESLDTITLTSGQADAITNYGDLWVQLEAVV